MTPYCPLCDSLQSKPFDRRDFRGQTVVNRLCTHCGLVYQSPRMTAEALAAFYEREYREVYQGSAGPSQKDIAVQSGRSQVLSAFIGSRISRVDRFLDIGCSTGRLMERIQADYGCRAIGVEPGEAYRAFAQSQGLRVYPSLESLSAEGEEPFDLISLSHVLEHLPNPVGYLAHLEEVWLAPAGWLALEVPNLYAHDCFEIAHLVSFSAHTLTETLRQAGFSVIVLRKHGRPRSAVLPLYLTVLAQRASAKAAVRVIPEEGVSLKRRLGMLRRRVIERVLPHQAWLPTTQKSY